MKKAFKNITTLVILGYLALLFNGEMYAHSWGALVYPSLVIGYVLFVWLMKLLIKKLNFNATKIFLTGSVIGLLLETFYSKSIFEYPFLFGVNWLSVIVQLLYWGMVALMPYYILTQIKDKKFYKEHKLLDALIIIYVIAQLTINSFIFYPETISVWIVSGVPISLYLLAISRKKELSTEI